MSNLLLAHRQKAHVLKHDLYVAQRTDGNWHVWIEGKKPIQHETVFTDQVEAKRAAHSLAHCHLEGKPFCDCTAESLWEPVRPDVGISFAERRHAKRFNHSCEIQWQDQGILTIGRIENLSAGGAFIETLNPAPEGSVLKLSFQVGSADVETKGQVIHQRPNYGMGVRFLGLRPPDHAAIANLLDAEDD